jgi:HTH-type transcriptional repressor of NAD biosynthesis genes
MDPGISLSTGSNERGLVIGKFLPLTTGHLFLIESALARCKYLTVLLQSLSRDEIPGHLRWNWLRDSFPTRDFPRVRVVHAREDVPQFPHEHSNFWNIWRDLIERHAGKVDVVFSSEEYGDALAQVLGARHECVDLKREAVPISATRVRSDVMAHWKYLAPQARPHFAKRVLIFGPESTGKTTLARQLSERFETSWVAEHARTLVEQKNNVVDESDVAPIVWGQMEQEEQAALRCNRLLFCDTDTITTTVYARHFYGQCPAWVQRLADERIGRYDLILFCDTDIAWQHDPQRDPRHAQGDFRNYFRDLFEAELLSRGRKYFVVRGQGQERVESAARIVREQLGL